LARKYVAHAWQAVVNHCLRDPFVGKGLRMRRYKRILIASDLSKTSKGALNTAVMFAKTFNSELLIVHVIEPISPFVQTELIQPDVLERMQEDSVQWAQRRITRLAAAARKSGVRTTTEVVSGDPAREILRATRDQRADLLVMGTTARGGIAKVLLGSVADYVVANARCPVVTVRSSSG
jgi:nucleotide-binding universal stress UspA family protein